MKKIILTTGGTGGHIYPALAVADKLKERNAEVVFIGSSSRMEKKIVPELGYRFIGLDIYPPNTIKKILLLLLSVFKAIKIVHKEKPDAIIGFGNYISIPTILAGIVLRKKIYLQEQNANLGLTNKIFYRFSKKLFLAFESTFSDIPIKYENKLLVTGNPLRKEIEEIDRKLERERLKVEENEKILLITGGSLGAEDINNSIINIWNNIYENKSLRIYWATGEKNYDKIIKKIDKIKTNDIIKPYFNNIIKIMAAADLVLCRAGALTISEIIELEKPSILIPYSSIKVGQYANAKILEELSATYVYKNSEVNLAVEKALELVMNDDKLELISSKVKSLKKKNSADVIVEELDIWRNE
ncbi:MAG: undecaprenyldiphospho-muramoylpentapeptide beta-N-acetylglucosaminyltransferase [Fusobacteriaceae bacterium]